MTTRELIEQLQYLDPDLSTEVLVDGYEDGCNPIFKVETVEVVLRDEPHSWYLGKYEDHPQDYHEDRQTKIVIRR